MTTSSSSSVRVREATREDVPAIARLAADLVRLHHQFDPRRFFLEEPVEDGYAWWIGRELDRDGAVVLVAEIDGAVVGYTYSSLEKRDWVRLLDAHGAVHDVFVDAAHRRHGVARALMQATVAALAARGAERIVLSTATPNESARALFAELGFRPTMIEMTLDVK